jgi:predicted amidohydrolase
VPIANPSSLTARLIAPKHSPVCRGGRIPITRWHHHMKQDGTMSQESACLVTLQPSIDCDLSHRAAHAICLLDQASSQCGEAIYVLPEYYLAHLFPDPGETAALAEEVPGPLTRAFLEWAATNDSTIIVGLVEKSGDPDHPYNTVAILGPEGVIGCYRKTHLWDLGPAKEAYRECKLFTPGEELGLYDLGGWRTGLMICADGVFPEVPRALALLGADLILFANSRPAAGREVEAAAGASYIPVVVSNPVGFNGVDQCLGSSRIVGPTGEVLAAVEDSQEGWAAVEIDLAAIARQRHWQCQIRLRRPELYGALVTA